MKYERLTNWTKTEGRRPAPTDAARWGLNGLVGGWAPAADGASRTERQALAEVERATAAPPRYRSLLVPVNGEPFGEHALPFALAIARRTGAEVRVAHVHCLLQSLHQPETLYYDDSLDAYLRQRQQAYLDDLVRRLAKATTVPVKAVRLQGRDIADSLGDAARDGTDLVVMAAHRRGPLGCLWFGSVADQLLPRLAVPLLLVRGYDAPADLTGNPPLRHVLIPLDGSALAEEILEPALALGASTGADHTLLRVVPGAGLVRPLDGGRATEARDYLRRTMTRLGGPALRLRGQIVPGRQPVAATILDCAQAHDVDLIALATRGRRGLPRLFQGSVADRVMSNTALPVLLCRSDVQQEVMAAP